MDILNFEPPSADKALLEEGSSFTPKFDANGLVTAIVTNASDGELLMVAHMNAEALSRTLKTGVAHYWSRSRGKLWKKGETSSNFQHVVEMRTDCDQDALWLKVSVDGHAATCHTGRHSCFYRTVKLDNGVASLVSDGSEPLFDPDAVYVKPK